MDIRKVVKDAFYVICGILIIVFNRWLLDYVAYLVGTVMILYGIDAFLSSIGNTESDKVHILFKILYLGIFAVLMMVYGRRDFTVGCVIWASWSIMREGSEVAEIFERANNKWIGFISVLESIIVTVLAITLIAHPTNEHALLHIVVLGAELILEVVFPMCDEFFAKMKKKDIGVEK